MGVYVGGCQKKCSHVHEVYLSPRFSKKKRGLCVTVRRPSVCPSVRPSVRPSGNSLPASPPTLLMLESPNLYA